MKGKVDPAGRTHDADIDKTQLQIKDLIDASRHRHRLARGTPEYAVALEAEERLAVRIWHRHRAARQPPPREPNRETEP